MENIQKKCVVVADVCYVVRPMMAVSEHVQPFSLSSLLKLHTITTIYQAFTAFIGP